MAGFTDTIENAVLNHIFGKTAYTAPATYYIGLSTTDPGETGSLAGEPSGNAYARVAVVNNTTNFPAAADGSKANGVKIEFPEATGYWGTITHFFLADAAVAENVIAYGSLLTPKTIENGDVFYFDVADLAITLD
jgi:hypothetical protein